MQYWLITTPLPAVHVSFHRMLHLLVPLHSGVVLQCTPRGSPATSDPHNMTVVQTSTQETLKKQITARWHPGICAKAHNLDKHKGPRQQASICDKQLLHCKYMPP